ncbi:MAG: hypothetical protein Q7K71_02220 [Candidatus Omnitrophota bacterium]|nr:hypothetical protein [Candidatus Omnitrophota bacterium]
MKKIFTIGAILFNAILLLLAIGSVFMLALLNDTPRKGPYADMIMGTFNNLVLINPFILAVAAVCSAVSFGNKNYSKVLWISLTSAIPFFVACILISMMP